MISKQSLMHWADFVTENTHSLIDDRDRLPSQHGLGAQKTL
jgi:hypothetical protein